MTLPIAAASLAIAPATSFAQGAGREVYNAMPPGVDPFSLTLRETRLYSRKKNFEVVGHSYFKGPWLTPAAIANGAGISTNTPRVYDGIGYFGGYNGPAIMFGTLIADVRDPTDMKALSFVPCNPGTRCPYIRVNNNRKILVMVHDTNNANPTQPAGGQPAQSGASFVDVSDPSNPRLLSFHLTRAGGNVHGFEIDDRFAYVCANFPDTNAPISQNQGIAIIDYTNPRAPVLASRVNMPGNIAGGPPRDPFWDDKNPDGTNQVNQCHEIHVHNNRLYVAWRDIGAVIIDVTDPYNPVVLGRKDYVPPFNGGNLGAAHSLMPIIMPDDMTHPKLAVLTDEIFCPSPPGFGRIVDISYPQNMVFLSNYRLPYIDDDYDRDTGQFNCRAGQQSIHHVWMDYRTTGLIYQAWYDQGLRVWDISNPFLPREVGYYVSPNYQYPGQTGRHTREAYQDPATGLIYMAEGNGGGITVLRWTGPLPPNPLPGAR
jgi:hypothetical protein